MADAKLKLIDKASLADLTGIIDYCVGENVTKADAKKILLAMYNNRLNPKDETDARRLKNDDAVKLCQAANDKLKNRIALFAVEDRKFKTVHGEILIARSDYYGATTVLQSITYEGDAIEEKIEDYLTLTELWFEMKDSTAAQGYCNKTAHLIHKITNAAQIFRYNVAKGKLADSKRDFILASQAYFNLGTSDQAGDQAEDLLKLSLTCCVLSPAGPRKSRQMGLMHKEERVKSLEFYEVLSKFFNGEIVKPEHVKNFKGTLEAHQNVTGVDGYTVLERALIEHNIVVISRIYMNITFKELGNFLGINPVQAEETVAKMVAEKRIEAVLDQANELVEFEEEGKQQQTYNAQMKVACENVDGLMNDILKAHPQLQKFDTFVF